MTYKLTVNEQLGLAVPGSLFHISFFKLVGNVPLVGHEVDLLSCIKMFGKHCFGGGAEPYIMGLDPTFYSIFYL